MLHKELDIKAIIPQIKFDTLIDPHTPHQRVNPHSTQPVFNLATNPSWLWFKDNQINNLESLDKGKLGNCMKPLMEEQQIYW